MSLWFRHTLLALAMSAIAIGAACADGTMEESPVNQTDPNNQTDPSNQTDPNNRTDPPEASLPQSPYVTPATTVGQGQSENHRLHLQIGDIPASGRTQGADHHLQIGVGSPVARDAVQSD